VWIKLIFLHTCTATNIAARPKGWRSRSVNIVLHLLIKTNISPGLVVLIKRYQHADLDSRIDRPVPPTKLITDIA
jgi:hypothetical protein